MLGNEHPSTASTYNNIATVYYNQGDYAKALEWLGKASVIFEKVLGKEHPRTASTYNNIAIVKRKIEKKQRTVRSIFRSIFCPR